MAEQSKALALAEYLDTRIVEFDNARPTSLDLSSKQIVRVAKNAILGNPDLMKCTPLSVYQACMRATQDGVILDGKQAALIPYGDKAQYVLMYRGMILIAYRTGMVQTVDAHVVYQREVDEDRFELIAGDTPRIVHRPTMFGDRGEPAGFYSIVTMKGGGTSREFMNREEVDAIRARSKRPNPVWKTDYVEMGKKTVLRRHFKRLPFGITMHTRDADEFDQRPEADPEGESQETQEVQAQRAPRKRAGAAAERLKAAREPEPDVTDIDPETGEVMDEEAYAGDVI